MVVLPALYWLYGERTVLSAEEREVAGFRQCSRVILR